MRQYRRQLVLRNYSNKVLRFFLVAIMCIIAVLLSGLREINYDDRYNDTPVYEYKYKLISQTSWEQLFKDFSFYSTDYGERDVGYPFFVKISQLIVDDFVFFMFISAIFFLVPLSMLIYQYVKSFLGTILSFSIYFALYTNIVNSFMRQAITLGFFLYAVKYVVNRNWKKYFTIIIIGATIHSSSFLALPFYFLPKLASSKKWIMIFLVIFPFLMFFSSSLMKFFASGSVYEIYGDSAMRNPVYFIIFLILSSVMSYFAYDKIKKTDNYEVLMCGVLGQIIFLPLIWIGGTLIRISYYYSIFLILLFPIILDNINIRHNLRIISYIFMISFFLFYAYSSLG